jgi:Tfp pilus assembly protein PilE
MLRPAVEPSERQSGALRRRLAAQTGQTVVQLLAGLVVGGILVAVAVVFYGQHQEDRADQEAAAAIVRGAEPAVQAFYADNGTYKGMTLVNLILRDPYLPLTSSPTDLGSSTYCIKATVRGKTAWKANPDGAIQATKPAGCTE